MHHEAWCFLQEQRALLNPETILDVGGQNVNGTPRDLWSDAEYTALDYYEGQGVGIVADASTWKPTKKWDMVICTETFEHIPTEKHLPILKMMAKATNPGSYLVFTCATDPRHRHAANGDPSISPDEYYGNVDPELLKKNLTKAKWTVEEFIVNPHPGDIYFRAVNSTSPQKSSGRS